MSREIVLATLCFPRRAGQTLFIDYTQTTHPIHEGNYAASGGKFDATKDKALEDCARRELGEETDIVARELIYRGKVMFLNANHTTRNGRLIDKDFDVSLYDCYDFNDSAAKNKEGRLVWIDNKKVLDMPLHDGDRIIWSEWLNKMLRFDGWLEYEGTKLAKYGLKRFTPFND